LINPRPESLASPTEENLEGNTCQKSTLEGRGRRIRTRGRRKAVSIFRVFNGGGRPVFYDPSPFSGGKGDDIPPWGEEEAIIFLREGRGPSQFPDQNPRNP